MKRLSLLLAILCMFGFAVNAQTNSNSGSHATKDQPDFTTGKCYLNAGVGVGYGLPIAVSGEWAVATNMINGRNGSIGVGGYVGVNVPLSSNQYFGIDIVARGAFHYQWVTKLDTYAGLGIGYHGYNNESFKSTVYGSLFVGARYYFWDNIGLYAELGGGLNYGALSIGACFKL